MLIDVLIALLILALVAGAIEWLMPPSKYKQIALVLLAVIAIVYLVYVLVPLARVG